MRPQGSPAELERRRRQAIAWLEQDVPVYVVAERMGVDRRSVRRWKRAYRQRGVAALAAQPASGRPPKLTSRQRHALVQAIVKGPEVVGYPTGLWTCRRIAQFVRAQFGVAYHPDHIGRLLRTCGLTPQRPQRIAKERDDRRVRQWVRVEWPRVKKTPPARRASRVPR